MKKIKTIIVDDHEVFRMGLKLLLSKIDEVKVVAEASNGEEFLDLLKEQETDLVFMDINMPILNGIEATNQALLKHPRLKIIALTAFCDTEHFNNMIYAGVAGFLLKNSTLDDYRKAIDKVSKGGNYFSEEMLVKCTRNFISQKEVEKVKTKIADLSNRDRTVERHKTNLISKTETRNTVNLVIFAFKNKMIEI